MRTVATQSAALPATAAPSVTASSVTAPSVTASSVTASSVTASLAPAPSTALAATVATPIGPFTVIAEVAGGTAGAATVLASGWTDDLAALLPQVAAALRPSAITTVEAIDGITEAVIAYHDGDLTAIDAVPVRQTSGQFRSNAWDVLRTVRAGEPVTYTRYAELAGRPAAVRAAAGACAANAAALFVPCHRVLRTDGTLGGFRWGLPAKRWLLDHEAA
jgi:methylated-DNA-[protein]-cysteine S-methyltransferase